MKNGGIACIPKSAPERHLLRYLRSCAVNTGGGQFIRPDALDLPDLLGMEMRWLSE
jgi:hypothetical protein